MQVPKKHGNEIIWHNVKWEKYELYTLKENEVRPSQMANVEGWALAFFPLVFVFILQWFAWKPEKLLCSWVKPLQKNKMSQKIKC